MIEKGNIELMKENTTVYF